jgi:hypothetical protein
VSASVPRKVIEQIKKAGLPTGGPHPFKPKLRTNRRGEKEIERKAATRGPKRGKKGYVDNQGRIWIRDRAHADVPDHWDVQINGGEDYFRFDQRGNEIAPDLARGR